MIYGNHSNRKNSQDDWWLVYCVKEPWQRKIIEIHCRMTDRENPCLHSWLPNPIDDWMIKLTKNQEYGNKKQNPGVDLKMSLTCCGCLHISIGCKNKVSRFISFWISQTFSYKVTTPSSEKKNQEKYPSQTIRYWPTSESFLTLFSQPASVSFLYKFADQAAVNEKWMRREWDSYLMHRILISIKIGLGFIPK